MPSMKLLFSNKQVLLLMLIFGFIQGVFNTLGTVVGEIANRYGFSTDDASVFGAVFIIGGLVGSAAFGVWVEIKKVYKISVIVISLLSVGSMVGTSVAFTSGASWLVTLSCFIVGASMIPIMAVGFELGVEVTYPIDESYSTGLLMFAG
jgi:MFS transporter, FLVCR family, feline leukemia virus subgroup C receptor-related protein